MEAKFEATGLMIQQYYNYLANCTDTSVDNYAKECNLSIEVVTALDILARYADTLNVKDEAIIW